MIILVDTSVWSLAFRRQKQLSGEQLRIKEDLTELIREGRTRLIGPIRQELLSGIQSEEQYAQVRDHLRPFEDAPLSVEDYEEAALVNNRCRAQGVCGSPVDFLICAAAMRRNWLVFTTDKDFVAYARVLPVRLYAPRVTG